MEPLYSPGFKKETMAYSPAMRVGGLVFISGQVPLDPETGKVIGSTMAEQTRQTLVNLNSLLKNNDLTLQNLAKMTIYITDIAKIGMMNEVYKELLGEHKPARACVEVSHLASDMMIEIEAIAVIE